MKQYWPLIGLLLNCAVLVQCESYYSIIAPGGIKSNRKYTVSVSLHEADGPATINVRIEGPFYYSAQDVSLQPHQTKSAVFVLPKLAAGVHKLIAEGISGIKFRNESQISAYNLDNGARTYVQTDKAIYKPGDEVQFRVVMLDEHTRPLKIQEPILVEIMDAKRNRVKQFKDIALVKGIYKAKFLLSEYPVLGHWQIKVTINGKYDESRSQTFQVQKYVLPKFSVYIKADDNFILPDDRIVKALVYGKYTFDKYVEGNLTASIVDPWEKKILQQKEMTVNRTAVVEFSFNNPKDLEKISIVQLRLELTEKHTGITRKAEKSIQIRQQRYQINVDSDSIKFQGNKPYLLTAQVLHWNGSPVRDRKTPVIMKHGTKDYDVFLNDKGEAIFEFDHDSNANHIFQFENSTYTYLNIYGGDQKSRNDSETYCRLRLKGDRPRLGTMLEIEVSSNDIIPYITYVIMGHSNIIKTEQITVPANQKSYVIEIMPSIEMVPTSFIYVHYVRNGHFRYDELILKFPQKFENQISIMAPKQVKPGRNITIELKAQPKSYVALLAVDLGVYLLDSSYDLRGENILRDLKFDQTYAPFDFYINPGILSGVLTLTNAHHPRIAKSGSGSGYGGGHAAAGTPPVDYRRNFPETWIFENYEITHETTQVSLTIPDSITTWRITAFSVHELTGFGIVDGPTDILARQPFFINLNLPYSVKRGEFVRIPIIVYNYHNQSVDSEITLYNQDREFDFVESDISTADRDSENQKRVKRALVPQNGVEKVEFLINPKRVGDISLRVTAVNELSSDAVLRKLKVEPEGVARHENKPLYTRIPLGGTFSSSIVADVPEDIVAESEYLTLSVGGDSLVPTLKNLNGLVLLPTGCGEQNMVNFAPNILVLQYLRASGKYFKERGLVAKAKKFIEIGYQQQLSYRHDNGGFSVFGPRKDTEASTWLTAYAIRFFIKVSNYLSIEPRIIDSGLEYLSKEQLLGGNFPYTGYLFYPAQQNRFGFTAFVLMTFLENERHATKYERTIQKGLAFLTKNLDKINDTYALSIVAAALQKAKHGNAKEAIEKLKVNKHQQEDLMWWSQNDQNREKDVEITAYALMALLDIENDPTEDLNILKWLVGQRNARGGFKSTHDTVVGLQALVKFSEKYNSKDNMNLKIQYSAKNNLSEVLESNEIMVNANNVLILQTLQLPQSTRALDVNVTGAGYSLMQLSYNYHVATNDELKHFQIKPKPMMPNPDEMLLEVCFSYQQPNTSAPDDSSSTTNMIIMEANLPSGFTTNDEFSKELLENEIVQRIESTNSETTLVIYFRKLSANIGHCLHILAAKLHDVLERKPASIALYDYYNISRHETVFYTI